MGFAGTVLGFLIKISYRVGSTDTSLRLNTSSIEDLETRFERMSHKLSALITYVISTFNAPSSIFSQGSPTVLGELGIEILENSGGKNYIDSHLDELILKMQEYELKSALDVQNYSSNVILDLSDSDDFIELKNFIYQNPKYGKARLSLALISQVMGIYLRDEFFKKNPELQNVEPVDSTE